jgi:hypothetical protein
MRVIVSLGAKSTKALNFGKETASQRACIRDPCRIRTGDPLFTPWRFIQAESSGPGPRFRTS